MRAAAGCRPAGAPGARAKGNGRDGPPWGNLTVLSARPSDSTSTRSVVVRVASGALSCDFTDMDARRGGRARLKASDSKSDRGVSPSGVQILSPPPIFSTLSVELGSGGVAEWPKVRHWKCRVRATVPWVRIPPPPPSNPNPRRGPAALRLERHRESRIGANPDVSFCRLWRRVRTQGASAADGPFVRSLRRLAVLDGEVAVPCNPQSATAGLNSLSRAARVE